MQKEKLKQEIVNNCERQLDSQDLKFWVWMDQDDLRTYLMASTATHAIRISCSEPLTYEFINDLNKIVAKRKHSAEYH